MKIQPPMISALREELYDWRLWTGRGVVMAFAAMAGLTVVVFTWMTEHALAYFFALEKSYWWSPLLWTAGTGEGQLPLHSHHRNVKSVCPQWGTQQALS